MTKNNETTIKTDGKGWSNADFSIPIGVSYDCPFGIILEARYNIGVSNIVTSDLGTARNSVFSIMVGYRF